MERRSRSQEIKTERNEIEEKMREALENNPGRQWSLKELLKEVGAPEFSTPGRFAAYRLLDRNVIELTEDLKLQLHNSSEADGYIMEI